jgi:hypothetical protein
LQARTPLAWKQIPHVHSPALLVASPQLSANTGVVALLEQQSLLSNASCITLPNNCSRKDGIFAEVPPIKIGSYPP